MRSYTKGHFCNCGGMRIFRNEELYVCLGGRKDCAILETASGEYPGSGVGRMSAGILRHFPNTASAGAEPRAACGVEWRDSMTHGSLLDQSGSIVEAARAVFNVLWKRSIIPLASGL